MKSVEHNISCNFLTEQMQLNLKRLLANVNMC